MVTTSAYIEKGKLYIAPAPTPQKKIHGSAIKNITWVGIYDLKRKVSTVKNMPKTMVERDMMSERFYQAFLQDKPKVAD